MGNVARGHGVACGGREREDHDRHLIKCGSDGSGSFLLAVWSQGRCGLPVLHWLRRCDARRSVATSTSAERTSTERVRTERGGAG